MFKFSAVSQTWKKYIQKLNDWDLPLNVYFTAFKSIFLPLYAPITSDECHAWFHLNAASPAARNTEHVNITTGKKKLASQFNFTYRYIDDVLSINNPDFDNYLGQMYPAELEIKDTMDSNTSASFLDLLL